MGDSMLSLASVRTDDLFGYDSNCDPCSQKASPEEAIGFCRDCDEKLCQRCFDVHCIPTPSANHRLVPLATDHIHPIVLSEAAKPASVIDTCTDICTEKCTQHEGKTIEFYWKDHHMFGCRQCIRDGKMSADAVYIPDESQTLTNGQVEEVIEKVNELGLSSEQMFKNAQQNKSLTEQNHQKVMKQAHQFITDLKTWVQHLEEDFTKKAEAKREENTVSLSLVAEKYSKASTQCMEIASIMDALHTNNQYCQLFIYMKKAEVLLQSLMESLNEIQGDNRTTLFKFKPNRSLMPSGATLGFLEEKECVGHWSTQTNKHESVFIRSGKAKQTRVARRKVRRSTSRASEAFDNQEPLDTVRELEEAVDALC